MNITWWLESMEVWTEWL